MKRHAAWCIQEEIVIQGPGRAYTRALKDKAHAAMTILIELIVNVVRKTCVDVVIRHRPATPPRRRLHAGRV